MKRWLPAGLLAVAALASAFHVFLFSIGHMFDARWGSVGERWQWVAAGAIAVLAAVGGVLIVRRASVGWLLGVVVLIAAASFLPAIPEGRLAREAGVENVARVRAYEERVLAEIAKAERDLDERIARRQPYQPEEARQFMMLIPRGNMATAGGRDESARTIDMLRRALETRILDPNIVVKEPLRVDIGPEPLFIKIHRNMHQIETEPIHHTDWKILLLLAANGADLTAPGAEAFTADMRKTATPIYKGIYIDLK